MTSQLTVLISSCDKFSDLWDVHVRQYRQYWEADSCDTLLVTDKPTERQLEGVEIVAAGENLDFPTRIRYALQYVKTPYVLLTLDDYFLIAPVKADNIRALMERTEREDIAYLSLYNRRKTNPRRYEDIRVLRPIDLEQKYAVNLYPAIWSVDFLKKTVKDDISPWLYEVSLTGVARAEGAKCFFSHTGSFEILDVVRKGKVLHKARRYLDRHGLDIGDRPTVSRMTELKLAVMDRISWYAPRGLFRLIKKIAKKCGVTFYSES